MSEPQLPQSLLRVLASLTEWFMDQQVAYAIIGGAAIGKSRVLLLQHNHTKIDVDISLGALPFEQEMIERAIEFTTPELTVKVATPEDLIITKAVETP
jgi:hypothetical protein